MFHTESHRKYFTLCKKIFFSLFFQKTVDLVGRRFVPSLLSFSLQISILMRVGLNALRACGVGRRRERMRVSGSAGG